MSAYMVSKTHIDTLVYAALYGPVETTQRDRWYPPRWEGRELEESAANDLGAALVRENLSSIHSRYPDTLKNPEDTPGPCEQYWLKPYTFPDSLSLKSLPALQIIKAIQCYEYQSCEHRKWEASKAAKFVAGLKERLIAYLPGYNKAAWEIEEVHT